jgi:DNA primase
VNDEIVRVAERHLRFTKMSGENNIGGPCPFHKDGQEQTPSFYMNVNSGVYYCHSCGAKGTLVQFLKAMRTSTSEIDRILGDMEPESRQATQKRVYGPDLNKAEHRLNEGLLGVFDYCPVDLVDDGFDETTLRTLEVGFDKHQQRITFPIRDLHGHLVGISGRAVDGAFPRYKVYKSKDVLRYAPDDHEVKARYKRYDIKSHHYIWNMHNVYPGLFMGDINTLVIVEGYKACIWMIQHGVDNCVALQGSKMSLQQKRILSRIDATILIFLDHDKAGVLGTNDIVLQLTRLGKRVLICPYPHYVEGKVQPDDLDEEEVMDALEGAETFQEWRSRRWVSNIVREGRAGGSKGT